MAVDFEGAKIRQILNFTKMLLEGIELFYAH